MINAMLEAATGRDLNGNGHIVGHGRDYNRDGVPDRYQHGQMGQPYMSGQGYQGGMMMGQPMMGQPMMGQPMMGQPMMGGPIPMGGPQVVGGVGMGMRPMMPGQPRPMMGQPMMGQPGMMQPGMGMRPGMGMTPGMQGRNLYQQGMMGQPRPMMQQPMMGGGGGGGVDMDGDGFPDWYPQGAGQSKLVCWHYQFKGFCGSCKPDGKHCVNIQFGWRVVCHHNGFMDVGGPGCNCNEIDGNHIKLIKNDAWVQPSAWGSVRASPGRRW